MVKMLVTTHYKSKYYIKDNQYDVDKVVEKRWVENDIAESILSIKSKKTMYKEEN